MDRYLLGYALLALMLIAVAVTARYVLRNSRENKMRRRRAREVEDIRRRRDAKADSKDDAV